MGNLLPALFYYIRACFKSQQELEAENVALRQQLGVARRKSPKRIKVGFWDRMVLVLLYRLSPSVLDAIHIVKPATVVRWHRQGFKAYWRWKSRPRVEGQELTLNCEP